eukprot:scaffold245971_cov32-Prasinocladus_malaysianus.AAC.1
MVEASASALKRGKPLNAFPLSDEAEIWYNIGCYIGQETIAKVHNLGAVKQQLWGLQLKTACEVDDEVQDSDGTKLGKVTSVSTAADGSPIAMAYL